MMKPVNGTLVRMLRILLVDNPCEWDLKLSLPVFDYNMTCHRTIRDCPHFLLFHTDQVGANHTFLEDKSPWYNVEDLKAKTALLASRVFNRCQLYLEEGCATRERFCPRCKVKLVAVGQRMLITSKP